MRHCGRSVSSLVGRDALWGFRHDARVALRRCVARFYRRATAHHRNCRLYREAPIGRRNGTYALIGIARRFDRTTRSNVARFHRLELSNPTDRPINANPAKTPFRKRTTAQPGSPRRARAFGLSPDEPAIHHPIRRHFPTTLFSGLPPHSPTRAHPRFSATSAALLHPFGNLESLATPSLNVSARVRMSPKPSSVTTSPACSLNSASGSHSGGNRTG